VLELFALYVPPKASDAEDAVGRYILDLKEPIGSIGVAAGETIELRYRPSEMVVINCDGVGQSVLLELKALASDTLVRIAQVLRVDNVDSYDLISHRNNQKGTTITSWRSKLLCALECLWCY
jgi:hypothetical protein